MKLVLVGVAFATLMATPLVAQSQANEGPLHSRDYPKQKKPSRGDDRGLDGAWQKPNHPMQNPDPAGRGLCGTAPGFCSDYHGTNGG